MGGIVQAFGDTVRSALRTLTANKLRSALTLLGIVIGVTAVVTMSAVIDGLSRQINKDLAQLGTGVFQVQKHPQGGFGNGGGRNWRMYERRKNFTLADVRLLQESCNECLRVAGEAWGRPQNVVGPVHTARAVALVGGTGDFFDNNGYGLHTGRLFDEAEASSGSRVIVLGADVVDVLFPDSNPLGQDVRVGNVTFRVVGTLERRGSSMGGSIDNIATVPISTFLVMTGARQSLNVTIQARDPQKLARAQDEVVTILRRARGVAPMDENDFEMFSNDSVQESFEQMSSTVASASIGVSAIALLIGGIGVMNIMLVAVTERTSEIGVRRALGARRRRILGQFLVEAIVLTLVGGLIGIGLAAAICSLIEVVIGFDVSVGPAAVAMALIVTSGIGLLFGIYPASRAARLDPVEAMRHE